MGRVVKPGYVYVLDPDVEVNGRRVLKIGYTTQAVHKRVRQLSTGSVGNFRIAYQQHVSDAPVVEKCVHSALRHARVNREFFAVTLDEAKREIQRAGPNAKMKGENLRWAGAMREFKDRIGAAAVERRIAAVSLATAWLTGALWAAACIAAAALVVLQALIALPLGLFVAGRTWTLVHRHLYAKLVEKPFGHQIAAESVRLNACFPGSFQATWRHDEMRRRQDRAAISN